MDHYNGDQVRDRSRGSRDERDVAAGSGAESNFGRLNPEPDYYSRGRGRSPIPRRRRSRSPQAGNIDRYVPGGSPRPRRSRSPQRRYNEPSYHAGGLQGGGQRIDRYVPGGGNAPAQHLPDPHKLDYSVTYSYFAEWYNQDHGKDKDTISKDEVQSNYDAYKDDLNARLAKLFVMAHKQDEWFKERYMPGEKEKTKAKIVAYRRELWQKWKALLDAGAFDAVDRETKLSGIKQENGTDNSDSVEEINRGVDDGGLRPVLLIKTISPTVSRVQLEELAHENLPNFHFVSLSDPNPLKKFHRIGFLLLKALDDDPMSGTPPVDESTVDLLNGKSIHDEVHGDFVCHVGIHNGPTNPKARKLLNEYMSIPANLRKEAELVEKCVRKLELELKDEDSMVEYDGWETIKDKVDAWGHVEREKRETSEEEGEEEADTEVELKILKKKIDVGVEYLRRAFNFCMYCVSSSDSIHELTRKCPGGHIRRPTPSPDYTADQRTINWTKNWQDKLELFVNPPAPEHEDYVARLQKIGGKPIADFVSAEILKYVKQEDEGKYRCRVQQCTKLFKAEEFWKKHLDKKHTEWLHAIELDAQLVNAYVCDPTRVHPPKIEQNAQGNFQSGGGLNMHPSNRNLPPMPVSMFNQPPGQIPYGFPTFPPSFLNSSGGQMQNGNGIIQVGTNPGAGPIRRPLQRGSVSREPNGGPPRSRERFGQPYIQRDRAEREKERERRDREMKDAQQASRASRAVPASPEGADAELAVMGRAVKSYKDLDATGQGKIDELDY